MFQSIDPPFSLIPRPSPISSRNRSSKSSGNGTCLRKSTENWGTHKGDSAFRNYRLSESHKADRADTSRRTPGKSVVTSYDRASDRSVLVEKLDDSFELRNERGKRSLRNTRTELLYNFFVSCQGLSLSFFLWDLSLSRTSSFAIALIASYGLEKCSDKPFKGIELRSGYTLLIGYRAWDLLTW